MSRFEGVAWCGMHAAPAGVGQARVGNRRSCAVLSNIFFPSLLLLSVLRRVQRGREGLDDDDARPPFPD